MRSTSARSSIRATTAAPSLPSGVFPVRYTLAIGLAAERLFEELPKATRKQLQDLPAVVQRLEQHAQATRQRIEELNGLLGDLGTGETAALRDLTLAREAAQARLQEAVTSLETIRLDLLRLHAGTGAIEGITQDLSKAGDIAADIERLLEGREEVERALRSLDSESPAT